MHFAFSFFYYSSKLKSKTDNYFYKQYWNRSLLKECQRMKFVFKYLSFKIVILIIYTDIFVLKFVFIDRWNISIIKDK